MYTTFYTNSLRVRIGLKTCVHAASSWSRDSLPYVSLDVFWKAFQVTYSADVEWSWIPYSFTGSCSHLMINIYYILKWFNINCYNLLSHWNIATLTSTLQLADIACSIYYTSDNVVRALIIAIAHCQRSDEAFNDLAVIKWYFAQAGM